MANLYLSVDNTTNIIQSASYTQPSSVPSGETVVIVDDSTTNAKDTLIRPTDYEYLSGAIIRLPYFTFSYGNGVLTATLNSPPSTIPTNCTFTVCDQTFTSAIKSATIGTPSVTTYSATLAINIHPSVLNQSINVSVTATGCVTGQIDIGGTQNNITLQVYTPTGGTLTVAPTGTGSKAYLAIYWSGQAVSQAYSLPDITSILNLLTHTVFGVMLPSLTSGTTPTITLTANQKNGLTDLTNNVIPYTSITLEDIAPVPSNGQAQSFEVHYEQYRQDIQPTKQALQNYADDLASIPNLA
jgi:hypothetical protein